MLRCTVLVLAMTSSDARFIEYGADSRDWVSTIPRRNWFGNFVACKVIGPNVSLSPDEFRAKKDKLMRILEENAEYPKLFPGGFLGLYESNTSELWLVVCNDAGPEIASRIVREVVQKVRPGMMSFREMATSPELAHYKRVSRDNTLRLLALAAIHMGLHIVLDHDVDKGSRLEMEVHGDKLVAHRCTLMAKPTVEVSFNFPNEDGFYLNCFPCTSTIKRTLVLESLYQGIAVKSLDQANVNSIKAHLPDTPVSIHTGINGTYLVRPGENMVYSVIASSLALKMAQMAVGNENPRGNTGNKHPVSVPEYNALRNDELGLIEERLHPIAVMLNLDTSAS